MKEEEDVKLPRIRCLNKSYLVRDREQQVDEKEADSVGDAIKFLESVRVNKYM